MPAGSASFFLYSTIKLFFCITTSLVRIIHTKQGNQEHELQIKVWIWFDFRNDGKELTALCRMSEASGTSQLGTTSEASG